MQADRVDHAARELVYGRVKVCGITSRSDAEAGVARTSAISVADEVGAGSPLRLAALTDIEAEIQAA